jgi:hypothetical protein
MHHIETLARRIDDEVETVTAKVPVWSARKYPPPPRSGNALATAVLAAIPCLLLWVWALDSIRRVLAP